MLLLISTLHSGIINKKSTAYKNKQKVAMKFLV